MSQCSITPSDTAVEREYRRLKDASLSELSRFIHGGVSERVTVPASRFRPDSFYRRSATNSDMRKAVANSTAAPIQSSAIRGEACANLIVSSRVERYVTVGRRPRVFIGVTFVKA